ncbi:transposase, partial [Streptomyces diastaticus]
RVLGPRLDHQAITWLLERYGSPAALRKAGRRRLVELIRPKAPRMAARLIDDVFDALDEQTVVVPGTGTLDIVVPSLAASLTAVHTQRRAMEAQINTLLEAHPLSPVLTSMPGVGVRTAAVLLVTVGDGTSYPTAAHLASYAGLAPTTKQSGTSIHGEHAPRGGNRQLKRAMFLSAFACMNADPASRAYYDKQRARGKTHTQALLRLARQRVSVLFAMLRDGTFYQSRTPNDVELAA